MDRASRLYFSAFNCAMERLLPPISTPTTLPEGSTILAAGMVIGHVPQARLENHEVSNSIIDLVVKLNRVNRTVSGAFECR